MMKRQCQYQATCFPISPLSPLSLSFLFTLAHAAFCLSQTGYPVVLNLYFNSHPTIPTFFPTTASNHFNHPQQFLLQHHHHHKDCRKGAGFFGDRCSTFLWLVGVPSHYAYLLIRIPFIVKELGLGSFTPSRGETKKNSMLHHVTGIQ